MNMKIEDLPKKLSVFPLSNFIIFPKTTVPLNIFEPRYIDMINDSMKSNKLIGMIQPKIFKSENDFIPELHEIGCMGKIITFKEPLLCKRCLKIANKRGSKVKKCNFSKISGTYIRNLIKSRKKISDIFLRSEIGDKLNVNSIINN